MRWGLERWLLSVAFSVLIYCICWLFATTLCAETGHLGASSQDDAFLSSAQFTLRKRGDGSGDETEHIAHDQEHIRIVWPDERGGEERTAVKDSTSQKRGRGRPRLNAAVPFKPKLGESRTVRSIYVPQRPAYLRAREGDPNAPFTTFDRKTRSWKEHPLKWTNREYVEHRRRMMRVQKARMFAFDTIGKVDKEFLRLAADDKDTSGIKKKMYDKGVTDIAPIDPDDRQSGPYARARASDPDKPFMTWDRNTQKWIPTTMTNAQYLDYRRAQMRVYNNQRNQLREYANMHASLRKSASGHDQGEQPSCQAFSKDHAIKDCLQDIERVNVIDENDKEFLLGTTVGAGSGRTARLVQWQAKRERQPRKGRDIVRQSQATREAGVAVSHASSNIPKEMSRELAHDGQTILPAAKENNPRQQPSETAQHHHANSLHENTHHADKSSSSGEPTSTGKPLYDIPLPTSFDDIALDLDHTDWSWLDDMIPMDDEAHSDHVP